jgi:hypothetical protein
MGTICLQPPFGTIGGENLMCQDNPRRLHRHDSLRTSFFLSATTVSAATGPPRPRAEDAGDFARRSERREQVFVAESARADKGRRAQPARSWL